MKKTCSIDGCNNTAFCRGWCSAHYGRWQRNGDPLAVKRERAYAVIPAGSICAVEDCLKPVRSKGLCHSHYYKLLRHGTPTPIPRIVPACSVEGCQQKHLAKGLCAYHYGKQYAKINRAKLLDQARIRRANNPEQFREWFTRYWTRKHGNGVFHFTKKELRRIYSAPCFYCGATGPIELDHIIPISRGGRHSIGNAVAACRSCNASKSNRLLTEWLRLGKRP